MIYAENEILGNIKCLLMPGCLLLVSLLTPGLTVYQSACHIMGNVYGTTRIPKEGRFEEIYHSKHNAECYIIKHFCILF